jgi:hypothetical protein
MRTITALAAKGLGEFLAKDFRQIFGTSQEDRAERLSSVALAAPSIAGRAVTNALNLLSLSVHSGHGLAGKTGRIGPK